MSRTRILLDVDGVCADFSTPVVAEINRLMGTSHHHDHVDQWDIMRALAVPPDMAREVYDHVKTAGFCRGLRLYPGAADGVGKLRELCDVHPVTAPFDSPTWIRERTEWLIAELGFSRGDVVHTEAKHVCSGDFLIDDKTSTLVKWTDHQDGHGVLFRRPWNRRDTWAGHEADNWDNLVSLMREMV